jgi:hypothetical protein
MGTHQERVHPTSSPPLETDEYLTEKQEGMALSSLLELETTTNRFKSSIILLETNGNSLRKSTPQISPF